MDEFGQQSGSSGGDPWAPSPGGLAPPSGQPVVPAAPMIEAYDEEEGELQPAPMRYWWFFAGVVIVLGMLILALLLVLRSSEDETAAPSVQVTTPAEDASDGTVPGADPTTSGPTTPGATAPADTTAPDGSTASQATTPATAPPATVSAEEPGRPDGPVPGGTQVRYGDDLVRVNAVIPNAPGDDFFGTEPGTSLTAVDVEVCAGPDGFGVDPTLWTLYLDDDTVANGYLFAKDLPLLSIGAGTCVRGTSTFVVPDGRTASSVVLADFFGDNPVRWRFDDWVEVTGRLQPDVQPNSVLVGETASFGAGHSAEVLSIVDAAPPLDDFFEPVAGRQLTRIEVRLCAGEEALAVNPVYWYAISTEAVVGLSTIGGATLPSVDIEAGQCVAGAVEIDLPAGSVTRSVLLTDLIATEQAQWGSPGG